MRYMSAHSRQRGTVLIVSLIFLMILTLLGVSAIQNTTLEERMAGNFRSNTAAFQAAESALRAGENWLDSNFNIRPLPQKTGGNGIWVFNAPDPVAGTSKAWWKEADDAWWAANAQSYTHNLSFVSGKNLNPPRYLVEEVGLMKDPLNIGQPQDNSGRYFYQVTARGTGVNTNTVVLLRSTYARRY